MPAHFSRSANAATRWLLAVVLVTPVLVILAAMGWVRSPYATGQDQLLEQPVPFDHRHHVVDDGIDCRYCHTTVETSASAGIPSADRCMSCHSQVWNDSPLLEPVRESYYEGKPLRWQRVHRLPDFVFFDHSVHVDNGVGCESCHGRVDRMARIYQAKPLTMGWCLGCHRDPEKHLRPLDQITAMGWQPAGSQAELGAKLAKAYAIRPSTDCWACHR